MRICITGIAGFLGSHLARRLVEGSHDVCGIDIVHPLEAWRVAGLPVEYQWGPLGEGAQALGPVDVLVHAAGITGPRFARQAPYFTAQTNVMDTVALMEVCRRERWAERVIHISTFSAYGRNPKPGVPMVEDTPLRPSTDYGASKAAQELMVMGYAYRGDVMVTCLRMASMYGERERHDQLVSLLLRKALRDEPITLDGGGWQERDLNYVGNAVDAIETIVLGHHDTAGTIYNIAGGYNVSVRRLAEMAVDFAGKGRLVEGPARAGEEGNLALDYMRAYDDFGYLPRVDFDEGFRRTAEWVAAQEREGVRL